MFSCSSKEEIEEVEERLLLSLYGEYINNVTASQCRVTKFMDGLKKFKKALNLATLPPTSEAMSFHSFRVYYQVQCWLGNELDPPEWGWNKTETMFLPIKTTEKLAPDNLLKLVHCTCIKECSSRCGCRKAGLPCSSIYQHCKEETCGNCRTVTVEENENPTTGIMTIPLMKNIHCMSQGLPKFH